ncbi:MAG: hypothetical protein OER21_06695 [Gemmatimonadota bacterium]|nr:hypothetical protein [Gemmatimonadota bacterium]
MRSTRWGTVLVAAAALAACDRGPSPEVQAQLEQLTVVSAEKDSLLQQVAENARLMSEISTQLVAVADREKLARVAGAAESPMAATRDSLRTMVGDVATRVAALEDRLRASQRRVRNLTQASDSARAQFEATISDLQATIENQKTTIAALATRVEELQAENVQLATEKAALADTVEQLAVQKFSAYYVVGTKEELIERGIVTEEGGSRVLFIFGKRGKTLVPARELDPAEFTEIDMRLVTEIQLPDSAETYKIASRQNLAALAEPPDDKGKVQGVLRIGAPLEFWLPSKFLILVRS